MNQITIAIRGHHNATHRMAVIADDDIAAGRVLLTIDGATDTTPYRYLASYVPNDGDEVVVVKIGGSWLVLGDMA